MNRRNFFPRILIFRNLRPTVVVLILALLTGLGAGADAGFYPSNTLNGVVKGGGVVQPGYQVSLYASYTTGHPFQRLLGSDITDDRGHFQITYKLLPGLSHYLKPVFYILAEKDKAMLASAIGEVWWNKNVVVDELTTVAMGTAFAQFIDGRKIRGNTYGMLNAVKMAANMANPKNGDIGEVLNNSPNGGDTSTLATFYSLANIVASCVLDSSDCDLLLEYATPLGESAPTTVLQALANMTKYPSKRTISNATGLFDLSLEDQVYGPALSSEPTSWLLFVKFTGGFYSAYDAGNLMSGPGQIAFDERGFAWINDNYVPTEFGSPPNPANPDQIACSGLRLMKFFPWGESFPGSPFFGGGLSGAGFGITLDRRGNIWVGNFGFEAPECYKNIGDLKPPDPAEKIPAPHNSVSLFLPDGTPISGDDGFTKGHIFWPQGTVSDKKGNIWVANCGNDTVTLIPRGKPWKARNIAIPGGQGAAGTYYLPNVDDPLAPDRPLIKPFGIAIDPKGRAWVTGNAVGFDGSYDPSTDPIGGVYRISPNGTVETISTNGLLSWPMGIAGDSKGNMWISSSDNVNVPCVTPLDTKEGKEIGPALVYFPGDDGAPQKFTGGGLTIPWGNFVDGNDTVWVFNFGHRPNDDNENTALSHFCGAVPSKCPPGIGMGQPISPDDTGYSSDALDRVTGGGVDPSGNIWILNNWKKAGPTFPVYNTNPGGNSFVIVPGAAAPIKTPLIGPPESFNRSNTSWGKPDFWR